MRCGRFLALLLLSFSLGLPSFAANGVGAAGSAAEKSPADREAWVGRLRSASQELADARHRYDEAVRSYAKLRHRRKARGEKKAEVLDEREKARQALDAAEKHMKDLLEEARRAGVPPGWIREALDEAVPAAPRP